MTLDEAISYLRREFATSDNAEVVDAIVVVWSMLEKLRAHNLHCESLCESRQRIPQLHDCGFFTWRKQQCPSCPRRFMVKADD